LCFSTERLKLRCEERSDAVDRRLVVAGGFDFDKFTDRIDDPVLMFRKTAQSISPRGL